MNNIYVDIKYVNLLSPQLLKFKVKQSNPFLAMCRCPLCGDSKKNPHKTRGYIYTKSSCLHFKCHNCGAQSSLSNLIKNVNSSLYDQYRLERYREGLDIGQYAKAEKNPFTMATPEFEDKTILDKLFTRLDRLPETNIAVQYVLNRKIPKEKFSELFFVENIKDIEQLSDKYKNKIDGKEPRLVIPFYNKKGVLAGVSCRALGNESLRYLTIRIDNEAQMIYNIDRVDTRKPIFCVEGPFDSMFLPNAVAVGNSDLTIIDKYVPKSITTLIFDNQPRNKEICSLMRAAIKDGWSMVIWPDNIKEKDINDMVVSGIDYMNAINKNTFDGLMLRLKFNSWSKTT